jgi:hypothetical protein
MDTPVITILPVSAPALGAWDLARRRQEDAERQLERAHRDVCAGIGSLGVVVACSVRVAVCRSEARAAFRALNWPQASPAKQ